MRAALILALLLAPLGATAAAQTRECLELGPDRHPVWALMSERSKWQICAEHAAQARQRAEERQAEAYRRRWRDAANRAMSPAAAPPIDAVTAGRAQPRLSDDQKHLVLLDEVQTPARHRQPEIRLGRDEATGAPTVRIAGEGIAPLPDITLACTWSRRSVPLTDLAREAERLVASYQVPESIASVVRAEAACHISLAGAVLPLPRELVAIVWPTPGKR